jgi:tetratricopeptide (TPR) repeat protein
MMKHWMRSEAVKLYRTLAADRPAVFTMRISPRLSFRTSESISLNSVVMMKRLDARIEAVKLYRTLAADRPAVFTEDLAASSLLKVGVDFAELGRHHEALDADTEAVKLYRTLAADRPAVFTEDLASSLQQMGQILSKLSRQDNALTAFSEADTLLHSIV